MHPLKSRRPVALVAAIAVGTAGLFGIASSAQAAPTSLKFNCSASILTNQEFGFDADVVVPAQATVGQAVETTFSGTVTAPESVRGAAYSLLGLREIGGPATINATVGSEPVTLTADVPRSPIPATSATPLALPASGGGSWTPSAPGRYDVKIGGFTANLTGYNASGAGSAVAVTCTAKAPDTVVATINVVDAPTEEPTDEPTTEPTPTDGPTATPTDEPTDEPTTQPTPTGTPTPTTGPTTPPTQGNPDPIKAVVGVLLKLLKKLACKIIRC